MWKLGLRLVCVVLVGYLVYDFGNFIAHATSITSRIGMQVGNIVDAVAFENCTDGDRQLVLEYNDGTKSDRWVNMTCVGSTCLPALSNVAGVTTPCPLSPNSGLANCTPSTITGTNTNAFIFDAIARTFTDYTISSAVDIGEVCHDGSSDNHGCVIANGMLAVPDLGSDGVIFVGDNEGSDLSICSAPLSTTAGTSCPSFGGGTNTIGGSVAYDPETDLAFYHGGSFGQTIRAYTVTAAGILSNTMDAVTSVPYSFVGSQRDVLNVIPDGGDVYVLRRDAGLLRLVAYDQTLTVNTRDFSTTMTASTAPEMIYYEDENSFYICGGSGGSETKVMKISPTGTVEAELDETDMDDCKGMDIDQDTGQMYVFGADNFLRELDPDTLAILRSLELPEFGTVTIDNARQRIYSANIENVTEGGHIYSIRTCSSIG